MALISITINTFQNQKHLYIAKPTKNDNKQVESITKCWKHEAKDSKQGAWMRLISRILPSHIKEKSVEPVTPMQNSATDFQTSVAGGEKFNHGSAEVSGIKSADAVIKR